MPKTQIATASSQKGKNLSDVFISSQCITRKGEEEEEEEEKDGLDMVEIAHPMSYFKKKKDPGMNA